MSANKLTPGKNVIWESSRMMLPEHKERIIEHRRELNRKERVELAAEEWEQIERVMSQSLEQRRPIRIRLYDPFEELLVIGIVDRIDARRGRFLVDGYWFTVGDIESAEAE